MKKLDKNPWKVTFTIILTNYTSKLEETEVKNEVPTLVICFTSESVHNEFRSREKKVVQVRRWSSIGDSALLRSHCIIKHYYYLSGMNFGD